MRLHDVVGINCKNGINTENQRAGLKYMCQDILDCVSVYKIKFDDCVFVI